MYISMGIDVFTFGFDLAGLCESIYKRDWWKVASKLGCLAIDSIALISGYNNIKLENAKINYLSGIHRNGDQITLIDLTKEAIASGGMTESVKDILFDWAK